MKLSELQTGEKAVIVRVHGHGSFRKRLIEMGFIQGKEVTVVLNAPLKDPIEYEIIGYKISLRREEAEQIEVVNEVFAPSQKDIDKALRIIAAIKDAQARGSGVIAVNGKMVDRPVVIRAERTIALAIASGILDKEEAL